MGFNPIAPVVSGLALQAETPLAGFTLGSGAAPVISWTAPNDGQLHRFIAFMVLSVSVATTGGAITLTCTVPGLGVEVLTEFAAGAASGWVNQILTVTPGSTVSIAQSSGLSAGAATFYAQILGS